MIHPQQQQQQPLNLYYVHTLKSICLSRLRLTPHRTMRSCPSQRLDGQQKDCRKQCDDGECDSEILRAIGGIVLPPTHIEGVILARA